MQRTSDTEAYQASLATSTKTELWVYGSVARGTHSKSSDLDVLVVSDIDPDPLLVRSAVAHLPQAEHLSVRRYSWREVSQMAEYGSLFLLHLKLEGQCLHTTSQAFGMSQMLATLPQYRNDVRDIRGFLQALDDVRWALDDAWNDDDVSFELGVLATVIRHSSILACYKLGTPRFQMADSIRTSFAAVRMASFADAAVELYEFRLATARRIAPGKIPSRDEADSWLIRGREYVERVGKL